MQRTLGVLAGLTLAAAAAAPAAAQSAADARAVRFGVQGGISMPMGDFGDAANVGFIIGGLADWKPATLPVGLRFNVDYQRWGGEADLSFSSISGTADAMFMIPTESAIAPYVLGGVGMYRSDCSGNPLCEGSTDFGFNVGGGLNFNVGTLDTFAELRFHSVDDVEFVPIVFGIRF